MSMTLTAQCWKAAPIVSRARLIASSTWLISLRAHHPPHGFAHPLQDDPLGLLILALGNVSGDAVGADEIPTPVQTTGTDGEVAHVHLDFAHVAAA